MFNMNRDTPFLLRALVPLAFIACLVGLCWLGTEAMKELIAGAAHNIKK